MIAVGLWGAQLGAPAVWLLPVDVGLEVRHPKKSTASSNHGHDDPMSRSPFIARLRTRLPPPTDIPLHTAAAPSS